LWSAAIIAIPTATSASTTTTATTFETAFALLTRLATGVIIRTFALWLIARISRLIAAVVALITATAAASAIAPTGIAFAILALARFGLRFRRFGWLRAAEQTLEPA
jgi:hypothetical protein